MNRGPMQSKTVTIRSSKNNPLAWGIFYISLSRVSMTRMPADVHSAILVSISNILRVARYSMGRRPSVAAAASFAIGLGHDLPLANQVSSSAIQKSGSSCVAIIISSHMTKSSRRMALRPCAVKNSITGQGVSDVVSGVSGVAGVLSPNVISENVGTVFSENPPVSKSSDGSKSKSVGSGNSPAGAGAGVAGATAEVAGATAGVAGTGSDTAGFVVVETWGVLNAVVGACRVCDRARKNAPCNSVGRCDGISYVSGFVFSGAGVSSFVFGAGGGAYSLRTFSGTLISNSGLPVRMMTAVVATYSGTAARIKIPNVNPAKPRRCACISLFHAAAENTGKPNRPSSTAHVITA